MTAMKLLRETMSNVKFLFFSVSSACDFGQMASLEWVMSELAAR